MATAAGVRPRGAGRAQLHEVALRLFARDGVEGTSLQDIADDMGVSKAAIYYHYKTKDELVLGVIAPLVDQLCEIVRDARQYRGRQARVEAVINGMVRLALDSHSWFTVVLVDPYVVRLLPELPGLRQAWDQLGEQVIGPDGDNLMAVALLVFVTGLAGSISKPPLDALDNAQLRGYLTECGRRLLKVRRRSAPHAG